MASYSELLDAVDSLIAFADGIEPIVKQRWDGLEYLDLSQQDEARSKAREHTVLTLADAMGLSGELPKSKTGVFDSKLGMPIWPQEGQSDAFYRRWRNKIGHFRAVVAELAGSPPVETEETKDNPRSAIKRNLLWLEWAEEIGWNASNINGQVRDKWNESTAEFRKQYEPYDAKLNKGQSGWDKVRKGIKSAQEHKKTISET